ncbi:MAG: alpha/beta fold hydrolase [Acidimicrobiales bacterium]
MLHVSCWGKGEPVVTIHGFTQSGGAWGAFGERMGEAHRVLAVDAPGHGRSAAVRVGLWDGAALIAAAGGRGAYLGYSMGGRYALHVALAHPDLVERLVVVSATGGLDNAAERAKRRASDESLAERVERDGVAAFVAWWLRRPLFATLAPGAAAIEGRQGGSAEGLAASLRLAGTGRQEPLWDRLGQLDMPVLVVAGALDTGYVARGERLAGAIGANARLAIIDGAGHACHLERPEEVWAQVGPFLAGQ